MRIKTTLKILLAAVVMTAACSPNRSILESNIDNASPSPVATETPPPLKKITVGELMNRTAGAPADSFTFPCTLHAFKDDDRAKLRKLRDLWLAKEQDAHYILAPSRDCVCPDVCVLKVEDTTQPPPNNFGLIAIKDLESNSYQWIAKNLDLTNAKLTWLSSIPRLNFDDADGKQAKTCSINLKAGKYQMDCGAVR
jgi:hypothetical protein